MIQDGEVSGSSKQMGLSILGLGSIGFMVSALTGLSNYQKCEYELHQVGYPVEPSPQLGINLNSF